MSVISANYGRPRLAVYAGDRHVWLTGRHMLKRRTQMLWWGYLRRAYRDADWQQLGIPEESIMSLRALVRACWEKERQP